MEVSVGVIGVRVGRKIGGRGEGTERGSWSVLKQRLSKTIALKEK